MRWAYHDALRCIVYHQCICAFMNINKNEVYTMCILKKPYIYYKTVVIACVIVVFVGSTLNFIK